MFLYINMVKVPTQTFVVNSFAGVVIYGFWLYFSCKTIDLLYWLSKDPSNFVELVEKNEADDTEAEEDTDAEETD